MIIMVSRTKLLMASLVLNLLFLLMDTYFIVLFDVISSLSRNLVIFIDSDFYRNLLNDKFKPNLSGFVIHLIIFLLHFLLLDDGRKPIAHEVVNSLKYFQFFRWFLIRKGAFIMNQIEFYITTTSNFLPSLVVLLNKVNFFVFQQ